MGLTRLRSALCRFCDWSTCDVDILKARKKAAERKKARKKTEKAQPPAALPEQEEAPRPPEPPAPEVPAAEAAASVVEAPALEEPEVETAPGEEPLETQAPEVELLSFRLGGEAYAVWVKDVREVLTIRELTLVPNAPSYMLGVTSLRGAMLPVIDLCKRLGLAPGLRDEKSRIIVVSPDEEDVGLIVDRVTGVVRTMPDTIKPTPENIEQGGEFLRGIVRKDDTLYILLDLDKAVGK
jgi:purine-binding chemotaxis protein CheW